MVNKILFRIEAGICACEHNTPLHLLPAGKLISYNLTSYHLVVEDTTSTDRYERGKERTGEDDMDKKRKTHSHNATREGEDRTREVPENDREREYDKRHQNEEERDSERDEDAKRKTGESQGHETRKSLDGETNSEERSCENIVVKETEEKLREKDKEEKHAVNKFAKHSSQETVMSARERFLARKKTRVIVTQTGSDEEN